MKNLLLIAAVASLGGCSTPMRAAADCSFTAAYGYTDPKGQCTFHLESPINRANEASIFAEAFDRMLAASPKPDGIKMPKIEVEVKKQ